MNPTQVTQDLLDFISASPTAVHGAAQTAHRLRSLGFSELLETDPWVLEPGRGYFVRRGQGGLAAFRSGTGDLSGCGASVALAHTDSPGLKVKMLNQQWSRDILRVGVEVYGGPILSSWFDRELGLAGQVATLEGGTLRLHEVNYAEPLGIIPQLAIHYNREVNKAGFSPDPQNHLSVLLPGLNPQEGLETLICRRLGVDPVTMVDQDLFFYPLEDPRILGNSLLAGPRIDNLTGCHQVLTALGESGPGEKAQIAFFFEAEEVGSMTPGGAQSSFLSDVISRMVLATGGREEDVYRAKARSFMVSVDAAHGLHPNFPDRHDPKYAPVLGGGPVIKISAGARYASSAGSAALFDQLCRGEGIPCQRYIIRSDLTSGSTVGPAASSLSGIPAVDVGIPLWAMHSARETCSLEDHLSMIRVLTRFFRGA